MPSTFDLINRIQDFFNNEEKKRLFFEFRHKTERKILKKLDFVGDLGLEPGTSHEGLFGWSSSQSDFFDKGSNPVVEVKYVRTTQTENSETYRECDIKNGLAQVIEQAICAKVKSAVLVIIDAGRASGRDWDERECEFVKMFENNPFGISVKVLRVRVDEKTKTIHSEIVKARN